MLYSNFDWSILFILPISSRWLGEAHILIIVRHRWNNKILWNTCNMKACMQRKSSLYSLLDSMTHFFKLKYFWYSNLFIKTLIIHDILHQIFLFLIFVIHLYWVISKVLLCFKWKDYMWFRDLKLKAAVELKIIAPLVVSR